MKCHNCQEDVPSERRPYYGDDRSDIYLCDKCAVATEAKIVDEDEECPECGRSGRCECGDDSVRGLREEEMGG